MKRADVLNAAAECVLKNRADQYGAVEDSFGRVALIWSAILGVEISPSQVALMLAGLKMARLAGNLTHADSWVDLAGYAACGGEVSGAIPVGGEYAE